MSKTERNLEQYGGEYVELLNYCLENHQNEVKLMDTSVTSAISEEMKSDENENYEKTGFQRSKTSRASLYGNKAGKFAYDPMQPLSNPYRTSYHDQMPVRVFPLAPKSPNTLTQDSSPDRTITKEDIGTPFRAASMDDLLMSSSQKPRRVTRSMSKRANCTLLPSTGSSSSLQDSFEENIQPFTRKKRRSSIFSKTDRSFPSHLSLFTRNSKRKSRSEYKLNGTVDFGKTTELSRIAGDSTMQNATICCSNNNSKVCMEKDNGKAMKQGKLYNLRSRIQRTFGKGKTCENTKTPKKMKRRGADEDSESCVILSNNFGVSPWKRRRCLGEVLVNEAVEMSNNLPSLYIVLQQKALREEFRSFLANEHSDENLDFWLMCEKYKSANGKRALAETIYRQFLMEGAPREVNLDAKTKSILDRNLHNLTNHSFVPAQDCIYKLMDEDSYRRFCYKKAKNLRIE